MYGVSDGDAFQPPLVSLPALLNVRHQLVLLHVLVGLAVELKVGLELRVVVAQFALVDVAHHGPPLILGEQALGRHVGAQALQAVRGELVAHGTLKDLLQRVVDAGREISS